MAHKCYVSFKYEDIYYKNYILHYLNVDMIDKSLNEPINSTDEDYIMRVIRRDYLSDSTVTIFLIGACSNENLGTYEQRFIKRELQASLYDSANNTKNGILGIVLPEMHHNVYLGFYPCDNCGGNHRNVNIGDSTVIKEFSYNYYIPNDKCCWAEEERYCVLASWDEFKNNPEFYINKAFAKRCSTISSKTRVYP